MTTPQTEPGFLRRLFSRNAFCRCNRDTGKTWIVRRISKKLDLDEQQQQKLIVLQGHMRSGRKHMRQTWDTTQQGLSDMLAADTASNKQLSAFLHDELDNTLYTASTQGRELVNAFADFVATLDSDQRKRLRQHWQKRQRRFAVCHRHH